MNLSPIFLYSGWRTGGTALAVALKADKNNMIFYDPLNQALMDFEFASTASSDSWNSNHPTKFKYFDEYIPMFADGRLELFPDVREYKFRNSSVIFQDQLIKYLKRLVSVANENNKTPVFKFEQLEGHLDLLKSHFPSGIHIGLIRNRQAQLDSWLEQLALGSSGFFDAARKLVLDDPDFFTNGEILDKPTNEEVFEIYHSRLRSLGSDFDMTINLSEDNRDEFLTKIVSSSTHKIIASAFEQLDKLEKPPTFEKKFIRMRARCLELTQQRDELTQQRDELTQQRDEILNSTIWKTTKPIRQLLNMFNR
jgi:adenylate kinase family enzyme